MISAASPASMSGVAVTGSPVIHSETFAVVRSACAAAARRTSRSVKIPIRTEPSITRAEPKRPFSMCAATSATVSPDVVVNTSGVMISSSLITSVPPRRSAALAADLVRVRVPDRGGGVGESSFRRRQSEPLHELTCGQRCQKSCRVASSSVLAASSGVTASATRSNSSITPSSRSEASSTGAPPAGESSPRPRGSADGRCRPAGGPHRPASRGSTGPRRAAGRSRGPPSGLADRAVPDVGVPVAASAAVEDRVVRVDEGEPEASPRSWSSWTRASTPSGSSRATPAANRCAVSRTMPSRSSPTAARSASASWGSEATAPVVPAISSASTVTRSASPTASRYDSAAARRAASRPCGPPAPVCTTRRSHAERVAGADGREDQLARPPQEVGLPRRDVAHVRHVGDAGIDAAGRERGSEPLGLLLLVPGGDQARGFETKIWTQSAGGVAPPRPLLRCPALGAGRGRPGSRVVHGDRGAVADAGARRRQLAHDVPAAAPRDGEGGELEPAPARPAPSPPRRSCR